MHRPSGQNHRELAEWAQQNIDPSVSVDQGEAYVAEGWHDPSCPDNKPFRTAKQGNFGSANTCVEKPDNAPDGFTAWGQNQAIPEAEAQARTAAMLGGQPGGAGGAGAAPGAPAAPAAPLTLQQQLEQMFTGQRGLFGFSGGRNPLAQQLSGMFSGPAGQALAGSPGIKGRALAGGGIVWGPTGGYTDLSGFGSNPLLTGGAQTEGTGLVYDVGTAGYRPFDQPTGLGPSGPMLPTTARSLSPIQPGAMTPGGGTIFNTAQQQPPSPAPQQPAAPPVIPTFTPTSPLGQAMSRQRRRAAPAFRAQSDLYGSAAAPMF